MGSKNRKKIAQKSPKMTWNEGGSILKHVLACFYAFFTISHTFGMFSRPFSLTITMIQTMEKIGCKFVKVNEKPPNLGAFGAKDWTWG